MPSDIGVRLTGDNSEFRSMLDKSVADGTKFAGELTAKTADKFLGLRDVSHAVATALGLNLEAIAEKLARAYTGMSKEEEEAYKKSQELGDNITEAAIKNMRARLTDEQKLQLAIQERDRLQQKVQDTEVKGGVALMKLGEQRLELEKKDGEVIELQAKLAEKLAEKRKKDFEDEVNTRDKSNEIQRKAAMESMTLAEKEAFITKEIAMLRAFIASGALGETETARARGKLVEREAELSEDVKKTHDQDASIIEKKYQLQFDALSLDEQAAKTQTVIQYLTQKIASDKAAGLDTTAKQVQLLEQQGILGKINSAISERDAKAAQEKAETLQKQNEITAILSKGVGALTEDDKARLVTLAGQNSVLKQQIDIVNDLTEQFNGFKISITRTGSDYQSQSTTALQGVLARLKSQINPLGDLPGASSGSVGNNLNYGAYLNNAAIKPEIDAIERELALRLQIKTYAARYGTDAATYQFGDADTQRALRDQTAELTNVKNSLGMISNQLAASGLFPINSPAPR